MTAAAAAGGGGLHNPAVKGQPASDMQTRKDKSEEFKPNPL